LQISPADGSLHFLHTPALPLYFFFKEVRISRKLLMIPREKIPKKFIEYLEVESDLLIKMISKAVNVLEIVCIQPLASHPIFEEVHNLENKLDLNSHKGLALITKDSGHLNPVEVLYLIQTVEALEQAANHIEDAVDVMKIIGLKYQVRPLVL